MEMGSFYQVCVFFAVGLMVFTMSINFVEGMNLFGSNFPSTGINTDGKNSSEITEDFTKNPQGLGGLSDVFLLVFGAGSIIAIGGALGLAVLTQNATFVGVYVFAVYFWASYINALAIIDIGGWIPASFLLLFTVPIGFVFIGAIVGMLSGV